MLRALFRFLHSNVWGTKLAVSWKRKRKSKILFYFFLIRSRATCTCKIKPWNASYDLKHYITLFKFFEIFYLVCNYLVCNKLPTHKVEKLSEKGLWVATGEYICKKKNLCPEWDLNCCTPAWRSELLPTGLLGSVNRCWLGVASTPHSNVWGNKIGRISKTKAKIKNPEIFSSNLVTSYVYV